MNKMPKPVTEAQFFLHQCDYLASRRDVIIKDIKYNPSDYIITAKSLVEEIITVCKMKVANGYDRQKLIKLIADNNNGSGNPRNIHTIFEAKKILRLIKESK